MSQKEFNQHDEYNKEPLATSMIEVSAFISLRHLQGADEHDLLQEALAAVEAGDADCYEDPRIIDQDP